MAGLVPAIHVWARRKDVDARDKRGHDELIYSDQLSRKLRTPRVKPGGMACSVIEEAPQLPASARMLQLAQRLRRVLAYAFARHRELLADLFQRMVGVHADSETHAQHAFF